MKHTENVIILLVITVPADNLAPLSASQTIMLPFWLHVTSIPTWIHIPSKVWDEITYSIPNFNGCTVEVWKWIRNSIPYVTMGVLKLIHVSTPPPISHLQGESTSDRWIPYQWSLLTKGQWCEMRFNIITLSDVYFVRGKLVGKFKVWINQRLICGE